MALTGMSPSIDMKFVAGPACLVSLGIDLGTHVAPYWQISHVLCQATSKLQIQPFRFFCRFGLALAWTASLAFRLALGGFRFFAKWLLASINLCCITADMTRKLWSGMLLDHRLVNLLPQTIARKFLKHPRKRGFRRIRLFTLPGSAPLRWLNPAISPQGNFTRSWFFNTFPAALRGNWPTKTTLLGILYFASRFFKKSRISVSDNFWPGFRTTMARPTSPHV